MTREEAREFLLSIANQLGCIGVENLTDRDGDRMRDAIKALEESHWIPCSSGELPEEGKDVYVTCGNGRYAFTTEGKFSLRFGGWVSSWDNEPINVEAWMPEPEPYRKEGEEHD